MNNVFLHQTYKKNKLVILLLLLLIPFIIHGFYKNGLSLLLKGYGFLAFLKPFILLGSSIIVSIIYSKVFKKELLSYNLLGNILISLLVMPNINLFLYWGVLVLINIICHFLKVNPIALYMTFLITICFFFHNYTFLNAYEAGVEQHLVFFDYLMGYGKGGIGNTFLFMSLVSLIILLCNNEYKKDIPVLAFLSFYVLLIVKLIIINSADLDHLLNANVIFAFIFVAPISIYSPYTKGGEYLYGLLLGIITFIFSFIDLAYGAYLGIAILSIINSLLDKFIINR